jgi:hypothetical protein
MRDEEKPIVLLQHEQLVFEAESWGIIVVDNKHNTYLSPYATHRACPNDASIWGYRCWDVKSPTTVCDYCKEDVPECIVTLIIIEGWQR